MMSLFNDGTTAMVLRAYTASGVTSEPIAHVWYYDVATGQSKQAGPDYPLSYAVTALTNTTVKAILSAPPVGTYRHIRNVTIYQPSSDDEDITVEAYDGSTRYPIKTMTRAIHESMVYEEGRGWNDDIASGGGGDTIIELSNNFRYPATIDDQDYRGEVQPGVLGETVAFGEVMYQKAADGQWYKAKADTVATSGSRRLGVCLIAGVDNGATDVLLRGMVRDDSLYPTLNPGSAIYVSESTAGQIDQTSPPTSTTDHVIRSIGYGHDANTMFFDPDVDHMTHV